MLEPTIVTARVSRYRPTLGRKIFRQLQRLIPEAQSDNPHAHAEHALQVLVLAAGDLDVRHLLEGQNPRVEVHCAIHVGDRHTDGADCLHSPSLVRLRRAAYSCRD